MARQSISITKPNNDWLLEQVNSNEYASKSEAVNDLIRQERKKQERIKWLEKKLSTSEASGISTLSKEEIRLKAQESLDV